jgi:hypothetical protein
MLYYRKSSLHCSEARSTIPAPSQFSLITLSMTILSPPQPGTTLAPSLFLLFNFSSVANYPHSLLPTAVWCHPSAIYLFLSQFFIKCFITDCLLCIAVRRKSGSQPYLSFLSQFLINRFITDSLFFTAVRHDSPHRLSFSSVHNHKQSILPITLGTAPVPSLFPFLLSQRDEGWGGSSAILHYCLNTLSFCPSQ